MEEIKVYHSVWKRLPVILVGFSFSAGAVLALWQGRGQIPVGDIDMKPRLLCDLLNEQLRS